MHEMSKLKDAQELYKTMAENHEESQRFGTFLRSFIATSRSVLQYAEKEAKTKPGGRLWYENWMSQTELFRFFRDQRNCDIHEAPVVPSQRVAAEITGSFRIVSSLAIAVFDASGNIKEQQLVEDEPASTLEEPALPTPVSISRNYRFTERSGPEDVMKLCGQYLTQLEAFIADGKSKTFLTP